MNHALPAVLACLLLSAASLRGAEGPVPFPSALDAAAVAEDRLDDINRNALVLGNGDLNGLLYAQGTDLRMRITKNDVWDARLDTSQDPPMAVFDVAKHTFKGGVSNAASYARPYPVPRLSANLILHGPKLPVWQKVRAAAKDSWASRGGVAVMGIEGAPGASNGFAIDLPNLPSDRYTTLKLRVWGTQHAQYYVDIFSSDGKYPVSSGWMDAPWEETVKTLPLPAGTIAARLILYAKTTDGRPAEIRYRQIAFEGAGDPYALDVSQVKTSQPFKARLDLRRALAEIASLDRPRAAVRVRVLAQSNVILVETDRKTEITPQPASYLPAPRQGKDGDVTWIRQRMPPDEDYAGMEVATALGSRGGLHAVAVVTSWESKDVVGDSVKLVRATLGGEASALVDEHERQWQRFWAASGVELGDRDFQDWWYRMAYYLRCFARPGAVPIGLWAGLPNDSPGWHSDYHLNYNNWQTYWAPCAINHPELVDPLVRYFNQLLPRGRWFAKTTYGCEGACFTISHFPFEPDPARCKSVNRRQCGLVPWGYTLGMSGMAVQNLWYCYLYRPDRKYLQEQIYPVLREVAVFYASFMEKCKRDEQGKVRLGPSYSPEHGPLGTDNVPFDIAYVRYTFDAAIQAAGTLGCDADLVARWRRMRDLLPPYPTAPDEKGQPVVVDWIGCKFREVAVHNITVPAVPVFPGDQVTWFSPAGERDLFGRTIAVTRHNHNNSNIIFNVARARLSMPEALGETRRWFKAKALPNGMFEWQAHGFYLSESVGVAGLISEFLVQSVGDVIRVFPCWPKDLPAKFATLGAQGGFLVSAEQAGGKVRQVTIQSTAGGKLRLLSPWPKPSLRPETGAAQPLQPDARGIIELDTRPGQRLVFAEM